jgi:hypothetical protein
MRLPCDIGVRPFCHPHDRRNRLTYAAQRPQGGHLGLTLLSLTLMAVVLAGMLVARSQPA